MRRILEDRCRGSHDVSQAAASGSHLELRQLQRCAIDGVPMASAVGRIFVGTGAQAIR
jgi:Flp pilus assembly CpaE family ATPase